MKKHFALILMMAIAGTAYAQLHKMDSVLYLRFQEGYNFKSLSAWKYGADKKKQKIVVEYVLTSVSNLYDGYQLRFQSVESVPSDTVSIGSIADKTTVTIDQLSHFIKDNYPGRNFGGGPYFNKLKKIYIIETTPCDGYITITRVKVNVQIED